MANNIFLTRDGKLDAVDLPAFTSLVQRLANKQSKVLLHIHGGLVNQAAGQAAAQRLGGPAPDGFGLGPDWEQIYVVWRTGPLETLKTNWPDLFNNDRIYNAVLKKLIAFVSNKLGIPGVEGRSAFSAHGLTATEIAARLQDRSGGDPFADVNVSIERDTPTGRGPSVTAQTDNALAAEFTLTLQLDTEFSAAVDDIAATLTFDPAQGRSLAPRGNPNRGRAAFDRLDLDIKTDLTTAMPAEPAARSLLTAVEVGKFLIKHAVAIVIRIIRRFRGKRDHGFYPTVVEELAREMYGDLIGATIWGMMKTDASDHFAKDGFGTALVAALAAAPPPRFAVSAHSAGAIWASAMLKAMVGVPNAPRARVAFLAPAVRVDFFADAIKQGAASVERFRMFTMRDELEHQDAVLGPGTGFIYPCSLLYLVSGLFEEAKDDAFPDAPLLGMQRFLSADPAWLTDPDQVDAVQKSTAFLTAPDHSTVYAVSNGGPGRSTAATSHGAFDDDPKTLESVATFFNEAAP